jgi:DNA-binding Lrp family transcriptional regulator
MSKQFKANRQYELLEILKSPQPPRTIDQMADSLGCTHATAWVYLKKLEVEGLITRKAQRVSSIQVTMAGRTFQAPTEAPVRKPPRMPEPDWKPKGGTLASRINDIYERAKAENNLGWAVEVTEGR